MVPSMKEDDIANLLWAWDQDVPLCINTGMISLTRGTKNDYIMYNNVCAECVKE